jgi:hypothetical protein
MITNGDTTEIIICNNKQEEIARTLIDTKNIPLVENYRWNLDGLGYATSKSNGRRIKLSRVIMGEPKGMIVDHINHNTLDNREANLRICTRSQNMMNRKTNKVSSSGYKGVYWHDSGNSWAAQISINNKRIYLGLFKNIEDAIAARKKAEEKYYGEFVYKEVI